MFIQSNIEAMRSYQSLTKVDSQFNKSLSKISNGLELPAPSFGAGAYAVANDMEALYSEYTTGAANVQDAIGFLETAQTMMLETNDMLLQMNELANRAATETMNTDQRKDLQQDFTKLRSGISAIITDTRFNGLSMLSANNSNKTISIRFGESQTFTLSIYSMNVSNALGIAAVNSISTQVSAVGNVTVMKAAVNTMNNLMAKMGSQISMIEHKANVLDEQALQQKAMESRINELDFAKEMKNFTSLQVVLQGSNAMVAQANMKAQMVLQLFG